VFNITGQKIFMQEDIVMDPGKQQLKWNGKKDDGNNAASGVYFVQLIINVEILTRKVIKN
jgi:hypothetical protein